MGSKSLFIDILIRIDILPCAGWCCRECSAAASTPAECKSCAVCPAGIFCQVLWQPILVTGAGDFGSPGRHVTGQGGWCGGGGWGPLANPRQGIEAHYTASLWQSATDTTVNNECTCNKRLELNLLHEKSKIMSTIMSTTMHSFRNVKKRVKSLQA